MTRKLTPGEQINLEAEAADRTPPWPTPLPSWWWSWAAWRDRGGLPDERPHDVPFRVPAWAWERYKLHRGAKPVPAKSAFGGKGLFTAWDPGVILRRRPKVDWVAVTLDKFNGVPGCTATMAMQIRAEGYRLFAWEARADHGFATVVELGASGYIGQAESEPQLEACMGLAFPPNMTKALVGKPDDWGANPQQDAGQAKARGWELVYELYRNTNPGQVPDSMGYPVASWCFGLNDEGSRVSLSQYLADLPTGDWSGYLAEELAEDDWSLIGSKP